MSARVIARLRAWASEWRPALLLGVLTIGSYGLVLYGFGIIAGPIQEDEGWSSAATNAAFMGSYLLGAAASLISGRALDTVGPRAVLWTGLIAGTLLLAAATFAESVALFIALWAAGGAITIAGLFYNVTMPITARLYPHRQTAAMTVLVTAGGFSSVVFLTIAGLLTDELGWRTATRLLLALSAVLMLPGVMAVRRLPPLPEAPARSAGAAAPSAGYGSVGAALRSREVRVMLAMVAVSSLGLGALLNHFVPAATAAGLSLAAGGYLTGLRGFLSIPGRALIGPMASLLGLRPALGVGYAVMLLGTLALIAAGPLFWIYLSAVIAGLVWGQTMPLQGLIASDIFGLRRLGTLMAVQTSLGNVALAIGPFAAGVLLDATGNYDLVLGAIGVANLVTLGLLVLLIAARRRAAAVEAATLIRRQAPQR